ncbi:hypothetical protein CCACVL1_18254 [Corchorus capsularis]|uniref:Uncharacterized protein n=1 Tax=Corchorus capsularis TaxID=210143 RepID=A0A1R3HLW5_COCAP|nr:hypothetical protein CCACVL1_18254 [Corchorus capsularis]
MECTSSGKPARGGVSWTNPNLASAGTSEKKKKRLG